MTSNNPLTKKKTSNKFRCNDFQLKLLKLPKYFFTQAQ